MIDFKDPGKSPTRTRHFNVTSRYGSQDQIFDTGVGSTKDLGDGHPVLKSTYKPKYTRKQRNFLSSALDTYNAGETLLGNKMPHEQTQK